MLLNMTLKRGTGQACAACKFQRRRCTPHCLLAPFFPADQPKMFQNVHRLFGVKHIQKLLKELHPDQTAMAIKSIKIHAAMREKYPVHGCLVEIHNLDHQIQLAEEELQAVLQQLVYYRQLHQQEMSVADADGDRLSQLQLGVAPTVNTNMSLVHQDDHPEYNAVTAVPVAPHGDYDNKDSNGVDPLWMQQMYGYSNNNANSMAMQPQMPISQGTAQYYNEMHSFSNNADDRQSYVGPKEVYESSMESLSLRDYRQSDEQIAENELKSAAACFSLTSFN